MLFFLFLLLKNIFFSAMHLLRLSCPLEQATGICYCFFSSSLSPVSSSPPPHCGLSLLANTPAAQYPATPIHHLRQRFSASHCWTVKLLSLVLPGSKTFSHVFLVIFQVLISHLSWYIDSLVLSLIPVLGLPEHECESQKWGGVKRSVLCGRSRLCVAWLRGAWERASNSPHPTLWSPGTPVLPSHSVYILLMFCK